MGMDESSAAEEGSWRIVGGTGIYAKLRGMGTYTKVVVGGSSDATAREVWAGNVAFDASAPQVAISAISVGEATRDGSYVVRIAFTARDGDHRSVDFVVAARNRFLLAARTGTSVTGAASVGLRIRPGRGGRTIRLKIEATDRVGNTTTVASTVALPG
jgi:hypothetical protein